MRMSLFTASAALFVLTGCSSPPPQATLSPDATAWVDMQDVPPQADKDQLLPTHRLRLGGRAWRAPLTLLEDAESLCGVQVAWQDAQHLLLRAPAALASLVRVRPGQRWGQVTIGVLLHEDAVLMQRASPDGERVLAVIADCEQTRWNLYLRRKGEPLFNAAMQQGWEDPDVFGGFGWEQAPLALAWTGPRSARLLVQGSNHLVTLRDRIGDVQVAWAFDHKEAKAGPLKEGRPLPILKVIPAARKP